MQLDALALKTVLPRCASSVCERLQSADSSAENTSATCRRLPRTSKAKCAFF